MDHNKYDKYIIDGWHAFQNQTDDQAASRFSELIESDSDTAKAFSAGCSAMLAAVLALLTEGVTT